MSTNQSIKNPNVLTLGAVNSMLMQSYKARQMED